MKMKIYSKKYERKIKEKKTEFANSVKPITELKNQQYFYCRKTGILLQKNATASIVRNGCIL